MREFSTRNTYPHNDPHNESSGCVFNPSFSVYDSVRSRAQKRVELVSRAVMAPVQLHPASLTCFLHMRTNRFWRTLPRSSFTTSNASPPSTKTTRTTSSASSSTLYQTSSSLAAASSVIQRNGLMRRRSLRTGQRSEQKEVQQHQQWLGGTVILIIHQNEQQPQVVSLKPSPHRPRHSLNTSSSSMESPGGGAAVRPNLEIWRPPPPPVA